MSVDWLQVEAIRRGKSWESMVPQALSLSFIFLSRVLGAFYIHFLQCKVCL